MARFTKGQCQPCSVRTRCTTSRESARNVGFPSAKTPRPANPRPDRAADTRPADRYAVRAGVEGTVNEFAHGHGLLRSRYQHGIPRLKSWRASSG
ncbi:transposase [Streptomyces coffeae]|uniref:transposase n=1 Tax=Streptomyces coffeae TaxID=621382 RepID=UPI0027DDFD1A|nr:transposase [Streptomyces coffeae]